MPPRSAGSPDATTGMPPPILRILGARGIPAAHGGFETFAERLALYLVARGWDVTVYCQLTGDGAPVEDDWRGVRRVLIPVGTPGAAGTAVFDWRATLHASRRAGAALVLGYNTAAFCALLRLRGLPTVINMDGIEWRRAKWSAPMKAWLRLNERLGCRLGHRLVADNPGIADHLATCIGPRKIAMIPYGADAVTDEDPAPVRALGLAPKQYAIAIARPEPENSVLEIVRAFSRRRRREKLVVLGDLAPSRNRYHQAITEAASDGVVLPGAIFDAGAVAALRCHARLYIHGHQVGGTNPSLVEALGAGNPVLARDNVFNRWVAGPAAAYFGSEQACAELLDRLLGNDGALDAMSAAARVRHAERFTWSDVLRSYEELLAPLARAAS
jgi:glycosyltransferase involved in cell wall biosynthesis